MYSLFIIFIMLYLCIFCHYHFCCRFIYYYLTKGTRTMFVTIKKRKLGPSILLLFPGNYLKQDTQNWNQKNNGITSTRKSIFKCVKVY